MRASLIILIIPAVRVSILLSLCVYVRVRVCACACARTSSLPCEHSSCGVHPTPLFSPPPHQLHHTLIEHWCESAPNRKVTTPPSPLTEPRRTSPHQGPNETRGCIVPGSTPPTFRDPCGRDWHRNDQHVNNNNNKNARRSTNMNVLKDADR